MRLTLIGYWLGPDEPGYPDPAQFVDPAWDPDERAMVATYLRQGRAPYAFTGPSSCRLCDTMTGSAELTDGTYLWPEGLAHYLIEHHVRLPAEFVNHVLGEMRALREAEVDQSWWKSIAPP